MPFPRLKNPLLCRILVYVTVLGAALVPMLLMMHLPLPEGLQAFAILAPLAGLAVYVHKNFICLMTVDLILATLCCQQKARKHFALPPGFSPEKVTRRLSHFGREYHPVLCQVPPQMLLYKSIYPLSITACSIEKLVALYRVPLLDKNLYRNLVTSAAINAKALKGSRPHRFLDKNQRRAPINQVMVVLILADRVEEKLRSALSEEVCKGGGEINTSLLPCVVDLEQQICTFDSFRVPYTGFVYAAKNRGINLLRRYVFGGRFPYSRSPDRPEPKDADYLDQTLWQFWRATKRETSSDEKRFRIMSHGDLCLQDNFLYVKWKGHGVRLATTLDPETRRAQVDEPDLWYYPKANKISQQTAAALKKQITTYFAHHTYTVTYTPPHHQ